MIKIKLYELDKHRNECTFRPYLYAQNVLKEIGIEFTTGDSYDFAWIAQASFLNKRVSLEQSVTDGLKYLETITGDYMLIDGQDSTSLIGSYEVLKESNALLLLKSSLLKDRSLYKQGWNLGRYYWGEGDYSLSDFGEYSDRIVLSGTNWLMTHWAGINVQWYDVNRPRKYEVSAMFQYPTQKNYEYGYENNIFYDLNRKQCIDVIDNLKCNVAKLERGVRVPQQEYYDRMFNSKIIVAPYGYGEMAPRDLEAAMFGCILIKPDMSYIDTIPNVFESNKTYVACKHDFSDLEEKIEMILSNYEDYYKMIDAARAKFVEQMNPSNLAIHLHNIFSKLNNIEIETI